MAEEKLDRTKITAELEQLQLEEARERMSAVRQARARLAARLERREQDIQSANARQKANQENCWHKKGGKGVGMLSRGSDHHYAVVKHQLCHGPIIIICQRCAKVWEPPNPALNAKTATAEQKAEYKRLYDEYVVALNYPTDNEMSGTQLFVVTQGEAVA